MNLLIGGSSEAASFHPFSQASARGPLKGLPLCNTLMRNPPLPLLYASFVVHSLGTISACCAIAIVLSYLQQTLQESPRLWQQPGPTHLFHLPVGHFTHQPSALSTNLW